jgi:glycosyltransferase involved in cell wall biosynthesis
MRSAGHRYGRRVIIALSDLILVHGAQAGELVSREFSVSPRKIRRIHHGHWLDYYPRDVSTEQARARLGIAPGVFVFGFVGLCKPYKNLDQLIEAFAAAGQQSSLLIAGKFQSQEYGQRIEQMLAKLDPARVIFRPGFVDDADLQVYVRASNVLVLPFTDTLTSGSAMLALSFGRPAVAPRLGGMPELIIEPCGVLYDAAQPGSLAQAMDIARGRSFDEQAILAHAAKFDWESAARPFLSALEGR